MNPPKGKLLIIGGAESEGENEFLDAGGKNREFQKYEILKEILHESKNKKIEIITTASRVPDEVRRRYQEIFHEIHYPAPGFIEIEEKKDAENEKYIDRINESDAAFFTGGDQCRLYTILSGTSVVAAIQRRYITENFLVAGTSAGAMAMSSIMITGGGREEALFKKDLEMDSGLNFLDNCIIDTHFIKRGRFPRLALAIAKNPDKLGIGLGEDTAMIIKNGNEAECRGSGTVVIIDGQNIGETNLKMVAEDTPIYIENLKVHLLVKGCVFYLNERTLFKTKIAG